MAAALLESIVPVALDAADADPAPAALDEPAGAAEVTPAADETTEIIVDDPIDPTCPLGHACELYHVAIVAQSVGLHHALQRLVEGSVLIGARLAF